MNHPAPTTVRSVTLPNGQRLTLALAADLFGHETTGGAQSHLFGPSASNADGHWVTIEGTHVYISGGRITKGPAALVGKPPSALPPRSKLSHKVGDTEASYHAAKAAEKASKQSSKPKEPTAAQINARPVNLTDEQKAHIAAKYGGAKLDADNALSAIGRPDSTSAMMADPSKAATPKEHAAAAWKHKSAAARLHPEAAAASLDAARAHALASLPGADAGSSERARGASRKAADVERAENARHVPTDAEVQADRQRFHDELYAARNARGKDAPATGQAKQSTPDFAASVNAAAAKTPPVFEGSDKAFIHQVHATHQGNPSNPRMSLDEFKGKLVKANTAGSVKLARADLVAAMNPEDVKASEAKHFTGAEFHFVQKPAPKADPLAHMRAPAGGAVSPVDGQHYAGGHLMPIHGLYSGQEKSAGKGEADGGAIDPNREGKEKQKEKWTAPAPRTPEDVADVQRRAAEQKKWDEVKAGPIGKVKWLGDRPGSIGTGNHHYVKGGDEWRDFASSISNDKLNAMTGKLESVVHGRIDKSNADRIGKPKYFDKTELLTAEGAKENADWEKADIKRSAEQVAAYQPRKTAAHLKERPNSLYARELLERALDPSDSGKGTVDNYHDVHQMVASAIAPQSAPDAPTGKRYVVRENTAGGRHEVVDSHTGETVSKHTQLAHAVKDAKENNDYVAKHPAAATPTTPPEASGSPTPAAVGSPQSAPDFAASVNAAASRVADRGEDSTPQRRGGRWADKVFIHAVHAEHQASGGEPMDLPTFKSKLTAANTAGTVKLSRADLVAAMHPQDVADSETKYLNAEFHFVRKPEGKPNPARYDADAAGTSGVKPGLFGQPTVDAATKGTTPSMFPDRGPAAVSLPGTTGADARAAKKWDPKGTMPMRFSSDILALPSGRTLNVLALASNLFGHHTGYEQPKLFGGSPKAAEKPVWRTIRGHPVMISGGRIQPHPSHRMGGKTVAEAERMHPVEAGPAPRTIQQHEDAADVAHGKAAAHLDMADHIGAAKHAAVAAVHERAADAMRPKAAEDPDPFGDAKPGEAEAAEAAIAVAGKRLAERTANRNAVHQSHLRQLRVDRLATPAGRADALREQGDASGRLFSANHGDHHSPAVRAKMAGLARRDLARLASEAAEYNARQRPPAKTETPDSAAARDAATTEAHRYDAPPEHGRPHGGYRNPIAGETAHETVLATPEGHTVTVTTDRIRDGVYAHTVTAHRKAGPDGKGWAAKQMKVPGARQTDASRHDAAVRHAGLVAQYHAAMVHKGHDNVSVMGSAKPSDAPGRGPLEYRRPGKATTRPAPAPYVPTHKFANVYDAVDKLGGGMAMSGGTTRTIKVLGRDVTFTVPVLALAAAGGGPSVASCPSCGSYNLHRKPAADGGRSTDRCDDCGAEAEHVPGTVTAEQHSPGAQFDADGFNVDQSLPWGDPKAN